MEAKKRSSDFRRQHTAAEQPGSQFDNQRMVLQEHHQFEKERPLLFRIGIELYHQLKQRFVVGDPVDMQAPLARPVVPCSEDDPATIMMQKNWKMFLNGFHIEIVDDQQRIFFQRPQEAIMPVETRFICVGRQIVREIHVGNIPPQIAGIHEVNDIRVFLFVFSGVSFGDFTFPDPRHTLQENHAMAGQRFMQGFQFFIPSAEMGTGLRRFVAQDIIPDNG